VVRCADNREIRTRSQKKGLPVQSGEEKVISSLSRKKRLIIKIGCGTN
jgi:hypothetical protein